MTNPVARARVTIDLDLMRPAPFEEITRLSKALFKSSLYGVDKIVDDSRVVSVSLSWPLEHPLPLEDSNE